jgi:WD40 repeat protein
MSPDGTVLAAGNVDGTISLWDIASGQSRATLPAGKEMILAIAFSGDGSLLASAGGDSRIRVWDVGSGRLRATLLGHDGPITALAFSADGHSLASGGEDRTVRVWDATHPVEPAVFRGQGEVVLAVAFSPDGRLVASSSLCDRGVRLWDPRERESRGFLEAGIPTCTTLAFTRDSQALLVGDERGVVSMWNVLTHKRKTAFAAHVGWVKGLTLAATGQTLVTGGNDGKVRIWDMAEVAGWPRPHS